MIKCLFWAMFGMATFVAYESWWIRAVGIVVAAVAVYKAEMRHNDLLDRVKRAERAILLLANYKNKEE